MRVVSGSQQTAEWRDARKGLITASRIKDVLNILKNGQDVAIESGFISGLRRGRRLDWRQKSKETRGNKYDCCEECASSARLAD